MRSKRPRLTAVVIAAAIAAGIVGGHSLKAADDVRCRVDVEALVQDLVKLQAATDRELVKRLLAPKQ